MENVYSVNAKLILKYFKINIFIFIFTIQNHKKKEITQQHKQHNVNNTKKRK
jgi:hypothetical protein